MASIAGTSPSREFRTEIGIASAGTGRGSGAAELGSAPMAKPGESLPDDTGESLPDDISIEPNGARSVCLAVESLDFRLEAREDVGALLEHLEIVDHRPGALIEAFARHDGRDPRGIDDKQRRGDPSFQLLERDVVDIVTHQLALRLLRRHRHRRE